jgi:hypothetical protein
MKMRKIVVHDEDKVDDIAMWVNGGRLSDGMVMETDVLPLPEVIMCDNDWGSTFGHFGRIGDPNVELTGVAIFIGKVELHEPIPMDVNIDAFEVEGGAKLGVAARDKGGIEGLHSYLRTSVDEAEIGRCCGHHSVVGRGGPASD